MGHVLSAEKLHLPLANLPFSWGYAFYVSVREIFFITSLK